MQNAQLAGTSQYLLDNPLKGNVVDSKLIFFFFPLLILRVWALSLIVKLFSTSLKNCVRRIEIIDGVIYSYV